MRTRWKCKRLWYQGPPGARGLYLYASGYGKARSPMFRWRRFHWRKVLVGTQRHYLSWVFAYDKEQA